MFSELVKQSILSVLSCYSQKEPTKDSIAKNLTFTWHVIRASEDLLTLARDKSCCELHKYYAEHVKEEKNHENWLADDLKSVGIEVAKTPVPLKAVEMVGSQFYLVNYVDPAALLGYAAVLECFPKSMEVVEKLEAEFGKDLFRTLRYHAEHDIEHGAELAEVLNSLPEKSKQIVLENAIQTARYFGAAAEHF